MAAASRTPAEKSQVSPIILVVVLVLAVALVVGIARHFLTPPGPTLAQQLDLDKHPIPAWVTQDAVSCQGDISKLGPQEQQRLAASYPGQGARVIIMAAYSEAR